MKTLDENNCSHLKRFLTSRLSAKVGENSFMLNKYQPLFLKYRPQAINELVGQHQVATTLANAIKYNRISHAYLFTGPRGTGKTSTARILAKSLNCEHGPTADPVKFALPAWKSNKAYRLLYLRLMLPPIIVLMMLVC